MTSAMTGKVQRVMSSEVVICYEDKLLRFGRMRLSIVSSVDAGEVDVLAQRRNALDAAERSFKNARPGYKVVDKWVDAADVKYQPYLL